MKKQILFWLLSCLACQAQTDNTTWTFLNSRFLLTSNNLSELTPATARQNLGLVIGTNVLAPNGSAANLTNLPAAVTFGSATGTSIAATSSITSSGGGIGYTTGAGGAVTQATSRTTGVTLNKLTGTITMFSAAQASQALVTFTFTNSFIASTDYVDIQHISATNGGAWAFSVVAANGSCTISIRNITAASITEATPLRFFILKAVTN